MDPCGALAGSENARIKELLLGWHAFEDPLEILTARNKRCTPFKPLKTLRKLPAEAYENMVNACKRLNCLRLTLCFGYDQLDPLRGSNSTPTMRMLEACQCILTHLTLGVDELLVGYGEIQVVYMENLPFDTILAPRHFEALRSLDLLSWYLSDEQLKPFLQRHADALRELKFEANTLRHGVRAGDAEHDLIDL